MLDPQKVAEARGRELVEGHTPGPWRETTQRTSIGRKMDVYVPMPPNEDYTGHNGICCIYDDNSSLDPRLSEEHQSNARLIASAPDLQADHATLCEALDEMEARWQSLREALAADLKTLVQNGQMMFASGGLKRALMHMDEAAALSLITPPQEDTDAVDTV